MDGRENYQDAAVVTLLFKNFGNSLCPDAMILFSLKSIKMHENVQRWK